MKITNSRNSKKSMPLKVKKMLLCGGLVLGCSLGLTGCQATTTAEKIKEIMAEDKNLGANAGFIKNGNEFIPIYYDNNYDNIHNSETGKYIGHKITENIDGIDRWLIENNGEILYTGSQIFFFSNCYPNVYYDTEIIADFDETVYEKYVNQSGNGKEALNHYELENLKTGESTTLIGYQVSNTQFFNFETYRIEEYKGYDVELISSGTDLEEASYSYE